MALAVYKTYSSGEILLASDLNSSFSTIHDNAISLISPITGTLDLNGNEFILDVDGDTSLTADTDDRADMRLGGVDVFRFDGTTASVVNGIDFVGTITGTRARLVATGDTNIGISIRAKGTAAGATTVIEDGSGNEILIADIATASAVNEVTVTNAATSNRPRIAASGETNVGLALRPKGTGAGASVVLEDGSGNEVLICGVATASAVNELTVTNAATGTGPTLSVTGGDTHIDLNLTPKGDGLVRGVIPTGAVVPYVGSSAPTGWVLLAGKTMGNASSGGTERANADTVTLYTLLWNSMADAEAPVSTGRGASAAADYAANKTITLPDARGRSIFGKDDMGGSAASRVTTAESGIDADTLGIAGGDQRLSQHLHAAGTLAASGDGSHQHAYLLGNAIGSGRDIIDAGGDVGGANFPDSGANGTHSHALTGSTANTGSNTTSANMPPALILNMICRL
jgi:hypothetical protein